MIPRQFCIPNDHAKTETTPGEAKSQSQKAARKGEIKCITPYESHAYPSQLESFLPASRANVRRHQVPSKESVCRHIKHSVRMEAVPQESRVSTAS